MKPKQNKKGDKDESNAFDRCQTPFYALDPLLKYLPQNGLIWEPAKGDGHIVTKLTDAGFEVIGTDILTGHSFFGDVSPIKTWTHDLHNSLDWLERQGQHWRCQVTNPPYSIKYDWLTRSYELEKPFALLLPLETLGSAKGQALFEKYGIEIILLDKRVNFKMPHKGYGESGAQFPTAWFTWRLGIGQQITFGKITRYEDGQLPLFCQSDCWSNTKRLNTQARLL